MALTYRFMGRMNVSGPAGPAPRLSARAPDMEFSQEFHAGRIRQRNLSGASEVAMRRVQGVAQMGRAVGQLMETGVRDLRMFEDHRNTIHRTKLRRDAEVKMAGLRGQFPNQPEELREAGKAWALGSLEQYAGSDTADAEAEVLDVVDRYTVAETQAKVQQQLESRQAMLEAEVTDLTDEAGAIARRDGSLAGAERQMAKLKAVHGALVASGMWTQEHADLKFREFQDRMTEQSTYHRAERTYQDAEAEMPGTGHEAVEIFARTIREDPEFPLLGTLSRQALSAQVETLANGWEADRERTAYRAEMQRDRVSREFLQLFDYELHLTEQGAEGAKTIEELQKELERKRSELSDHAYELGAYKLRDATNARDKGIEEQRMVAANEAAETNRRGAGARFELDLNRLSSDALGPRSPHGQGRRNHVELNRSPEHVPSVDGRYVAPGDLMNILVEDIGLDPYVAAGILGSLAGEANMVTLGDVQMFDMHSVNPDGGAFGIAQWLSEDRVQALDAFAAEMGKDRYDPTVQTLFMLKELREHPRFAGLWEKLKEMEGPEALEEATRLWTLIYEVPYLASDVATNRNGARDNLLKRQNFAASMLGSVDWATTPNDVVRFAGRHADFILGDPRARAMVEALAADVKTEVVRGMAIEGDTRARASAGNFARQQENLVTQLQMDRALGLPSGALPNIMMAPGLTTEQRQQVLNTPFGKYLPEGERQRLRGLENGHMLFHGERRGYTPTERRDIEAYLTNPQTGSGTVTYGVGPQAADDMGAHLDLGASHGLMLPSLENWFLHGADPNNPADLAYGAQLLGQLRSGENGDWVDDQLGTSARARMWRRLADAGTADPEALNRIAQGALAEQRDPQFARRVTEHFDANGASIDRFALDLLDGESWFAGRSDVPPQFLDDFRRATRDIWMRDGEITESGMRLAFNQVRRRYSSGPQLTSRGYEGGPWIRDSLTPHAFAAMREAGVPEALGWGWVVESTAQQMLPSLTNPESDFFDPSLGIETTQDVIRLFEDGTFRFIQADADKPGELLVRMALSDGTNTLWSVGAVGAQRSTGWDVPTVVTWDWNDPSNSVARERWEWAQEQARSITMDGGPVGGLPLVGGSLAGTREIQGIMDTSTGTLALVLYGASTWAPTWLRDQIGTAGRAVAGAASPLTGPVQGAADLVPDDFSFFDVPMLPAGRVSSEGVLFEWISMNEEVRRLADKIGQFMGLPERWYEGRYTNSAR